MIFASGFLSLSDGWLSVVSISTQFSSTPCVPIWNTRLSLGDFKPLTWTWEHATMPERYFVASHQEQDFVASHWIVASYSDRYILSRLLHLIQMVASVPKTDFIASYPYIPNEPIEIKKSKIYRESKTRADFVRMSASRNGIVSPGSGRRVTTAWWITDGDGTLGRTPQCFTYTSKLSGSTPRNFFCTKCSNKIALSNEVGWTWA